MQQFNDGRTPRSNRGATPPSRPDPINYNYTRTPPPASADQMIAAQQAKMAEQRQRDHMQYQTRTPFAADAMMMGQMGQMGQMPQMPMPRQGAPTQNFQMPGMPFRQYPQFNNTPSMPQMPTGGVMGGGEVRAPFSPAPNQIIPGMRKGPMTPMDFGDMTDEEWGMMYQKLSGMGAFNEDQLGY